MRLELKWWVLVGLASLLEACGGGGSAGGVQPLPKAPQMVQATSYLNFKNVGLTPRYLPTFGDARAYGDFSGSGNLDLFMAELTYDSNRPLSQATPAVFRFWTMTSDGDYVPDGSRLSSSAGCIHPRKAQNHAIRRGQRAPGKAGARAARHDRHAMAMTAVISRVKKAACC